MPSSKFTFRLRSPFFFFLVSVILLGSCDRVSDPVPEPVTPGIVWANPPNCDPDAPAVPLSAARRDSVSYQYVDGWEIIERHVGGGFAGWYFDANHRLALSFVDTTDLANSLHLLADYWTRTSLVRDSVSINVVRWDWIQLRDWNHYLLVNQELQNIADGRVDLETNNRVHLSVTSDAARATILQRLSAIAVPCWLVVVETTFPCPNNNCTKSEQPPPAASHVAGP